MLQHLLVVVLADIDEPVACLCREAEAGGRAGTTMTTAELTHQCRAMLLVQADGTHGIDTAQWHTHSHRSGTQELITVGRSGSLRAVGVDPYIDALVLGNIVPFE